MRTAIIMIVMLAALLFLTGCNAGTQNSTPCEGPTCNAVLDTSAQGKREISIDKLEIYHFHGTNQCYSCKTVGAYAEETVNTYFTEELKSEEIVFGHINRDLLENRELVMKYGATGSSLWIGIYKDGDFKAEQNTNVWYKIGNKEDYMTYLKGIIDRRLEGDMS